MYEISPIKKCKLWLTTCTISPLRRYLLGMYHKYLDKCIKEPDIFGLFRYMYQIFSTAKVVK